MFTLTEEQEAAKNVLIEGIKSKEPYMALRGNAGTGKSTVIQHLVKTIKKDLKLDVVIAAPTNKATKVLRGMAARFEVEVFISTIHSLLGIYPRIKEIKDESGDTIQVEVFEIDKSGGDSIELDGVSVLIIDEASMVSKELFSYIQDAAEPAGITVIFVGDPAQLPPINETESIALKIRKQVRLTKLIRQAESNPVIKALTTIRDNLSSSYIALESEYDENQGVIIENDYSKVDDYIRKYFDNFQSNPDKMRIIAWTRACVAEYNARVREFLYGERAKTERFIPGEIIVADSPYMKSIPSMTAGNPPVKMKILQNSEEVMVDSVTMFRDSSGFNTWSLKTHNIIDGAKKEVIVLHEEERERFQQQMSTLFQQAKSDQSKKFLWKQYYALKEKYADINYAYALTAHKSQGSTFENVMVVRSNIDRNPKVVERNQCLYVAISRCQKHAIVLN